MASPAVELAAGVDRLPAQGANEGDRGPLNKSIF